MDLLWNNLADLIETRGFNDISVRGNVINLFAVRYMAHLSGESIDITVENQSIIVWRVPKPEHGKRHIISKLSLQGCTSINTSDVHTLYIQ